MEQMMLLTGTKNSICWDIQVFIQMQKSTLSESKKSEKMFSDFDLAMISMMNET